MNGAVCAEIALQSSLSSSVFANLSQTVTAAGCVGPSSLFVFGVESPDATDQVDHNYGFSSTGTITTGETAGFKFGANNIFINPDFISPKRPGPSFCGNSYSVPNCMRAVITDFTPAALGRGAVWLPDSNRKPPHRPTLPAVAVQCESVLWSGHARMC